MKVYYCLSRIELLTDGDGKLFMHGAILLHNNSAFVLAKHLILIN